MTTTENSLMLTLDDQVEHMMLKCFHTVHKHLQEQKQPYLRRTLVPGRDKVGFSLLGDPAYPLLPHVMKEFATCTTDARLYSIRCCEMPGMQ